MRHGLLTNHAFVQRAPPRLTKAHGPVRLSPGRLTGKSFERAPVGSGCRECAKAALEALLPEFTDWENAMSDQATKEAIPEYAKRRRGEPSAFT